MKGTDNVFAAAEWDRDDSIKRVVKRLQEKDIYEKMCNDPGFLTSTIHNALEKIRKRSHLNADTVKYFMVKYPKLTCFYLLQKIQKRLHDVTSFFQVTSFSNCGYYTENISSFYDFHFPALAGEVRY